jgi:hypothetical protein
MADSGAASLEGLLESTTGVETMPTQHIDADGATFSRNEKATRPPPVDVPLDEHTSTPRKAKRGAVSSPTRGGMTTRRTLAILAVGVLGGAGVSQVFAHSHRSTASTSTTVAPAVPVEPRHDEPTDFAPPTGDTVNHLLASLDAITDAQIARVASTDGPQQFAAIQSLRQQHDDVRTVILTYFYGWLPYPTPVPVATTPAAAERPPTPTSWCASSPVDVASRIIRIPARQLQVEVDRTAHSTHRLVLDVLLERIELATIDQLSRLPGAGDLEGPSPAAAASDVINRHNTVRSVLVAQAWGECQP